MVSPTTLYPSARSMAATVEESTPPDIATAMVVVSDMLNSVGLLCSYSGWADGKYFVLGHEKHPVAIAFIDFFHLTRWRDLQLKIIENKGCLSRIGVEIDAS